MTSKRSTGIKSGLDSKKTKIHILQSRNVRGGESNRKRSSADEQAKVSNQPSVGRRAAIQSRIMGMFLIRKVTQIQVKGWTECKQKEKCNLLLQPGRTLLFRVCLEAWFVFRPV